ncbi:hypothetical protein B0F90DRAFT_1731792 [Multifurca ochricompacta]|uniref:Uncharacterized protein n=1 Tax=Multifurca ochricompacta TaxID=376703 RepID=A0AAD4QMH5_9AGAM|nr:hypothetical protein B0F90DRAFT_1731792 [Multifurca ochricompacta]
MSHINIKITTTAGGTQSPPSEDHHPMGASSIKGGNVGGIPDRQQRSRPLSKSSHYPEYFDPPEQGQEQTQAQYNPTEAHPQTTLNTTDAVRGQQVNLDNLEPAHDPQPAPTAPITSGPFKKMGKEDIRSATRA